MNPRRRAASPLARLPRPSGGRGHPVAPCRGPSPPAARHGFPRACPAPAPVRPTETGCPAPTCPRRRATRCLGRGAARPGRRARQAGGCCDVARCRPNTPGRGSTGRDESPCAGPRGATWPSRMATARRCQRSSPAGATSAAHRCPPPPRMRRWPPPNGAAPFGPPPNVARAGPANAAPPRLPTPESNPADRAGSGRKRPPSARPARTVCAGRRRPNSGAPPPPRPAHYPR